MIKIDVVSDLHIDQWDKKYNIKHTCGEIKNNPIQFNNNDSDSDILLVAGDISDDLDLSLNYLNEISQYYKYIIFVDGNHEHVNVYPYLYEKEEIIEKIKKINNPKIFYLPYQHFIYEKTVFIGSCGWWDYKNNNTESKKKNVNYFKRWIPEMDEVQNNIFINEVYKQSCKEYNYIKNCIEYYEQDENIENIIIVTHTVPFEQTLTERDVKEYSTLINTKFFSIIDKGYKKISKWIYGHTHNETNTTFKNIQFICYPRGRPEDYNREDYKIKNILI